MIRMNKHVLASFSTAMACSLLFSSASAEDKRPVKIGVLLAETGPLGNLFTQEKRAVDFAAAEVNAKGGISGRKVEVRFADTEGKPDIARRQAEKLALDGYGLLFGTITSGEGLAIAPNLVRWNAVLVSPYSKSSKLIGDSCQPRFFRTDPSDPSEINATKIWLDTRKETKWATIANDYAFGHDATEGFNKIAASIGKSVTNNFFPAFGTSDYAPYIQQIKQAAPEGLFVMLAGRDAINFITQAKQFGLLGAVVMGGLTYNQDATLAAVGRDAVGLWGNIEYSSVIDTPESHAFVAAWKQQYGEDPTDQEGQGYTGISTLLQAIVKADSDDPSTVAKTLSGGAFETVLGKATMRAGDHQLMLPIYFGQVQDVNGKARNVPSLLLSPDKVTPPVDSMCRMSPM
jgi:branched-chain amino acid transport system substrate-binding protein